MKGKFQLDNQKRKNMISAIKRYFYEERDEEMGDLAASMFLDFFTEELAAEFYNQGIEDCYSYMNDRLSDMLGLQK
ncbi:MAG: DUF2164 domain-containing protein [Bacillota bacterium]|nr:DUF2164 domain-containing protein [Bacillota bacterium]